MELRHLAHLLSSRSRSRAVGRSDLPQSHGSAAHSARSQQPKCGPVHLHAPWSASLPIVVALPASAATIFDLAETTKAISTPDSPVVRRDHATDSTPPILPSRHFRALRSRRVVKFCRGPEEEAENAEESQRSNSPASRYRLSGTAERWLPRPPAQATAPIFRH